MLAGCGGGDEKGDSRKLGRLFITSPSAGLAVSLPTPKSEGSHHYSRNMSANCDCKDMGKETDVSSASDP